MIQRLLYLSEGIGKGTEYTKFFCGLHGYDASETGKSCVVKESLTPFVSDSNFTVEKFKDPDPDPESSYKIGAGTGTLLTSKEPLCSGIVMVGDVREREKQLFFTDEAGSRYTPYDFCEVNSNFDVGRSLGINIPTSPWTTFCNVFVDAQ